MPGSAVMVGGVVATVATLATADTDLNSNSARLRTGGSYACEIPTLVEVPPLPGSVHQRLCSIAFGVAQRIPVGTMAIPFGNRGGRFVREGKVVGRYGRCGLHGLALVVVIKPVRSAKRLPALSAYAFMDRWVEGVAAWGVNPLGWSGVDELRVVWDRGRDTKGRPLVRLAGHWQYLPTDGGVHGDAVYEANTVPLEQAWTAPTHRFARRRFRSQGPHGR